MGGKDGEMLVATAGTFPLPLVGAALCRHSVVKLGGENLKSKTNGILSQLG